MSLSSELSLALPPDLSLLEAEHAQWVASDGKEGRRANLRGLDFTGADLSGRRLMEASLRGAVFTNANLSKADLRGADLAEANLDGASLCRAQLHRTNATGADMGTANFTGAIAEGANLTHAKLSGAILRDANFRQAVFKGAAMRDANLRGATLVEADLGFADLTSADCRDVNFDHAKFAGAVLQNANFRGAKLGDVDLQAADFSLALDVASEAMAHAAQAERGKLQDEHAKIAALQDEIDRKVQALEAEKAQLAERVAGLRELRAVQEEATRRIAKFSGGFILAAVLWVMFTATVAAFTINIAVQLHHVNLQRFAFIIGTVVFALALALFSMVRSLQTGRAVKDMNKALEAVLTQGGNGKAEAPEDAEVGGRPSGFGKKK